MNRRDFLLSLVAAPAVLAHEPLAYVTADTEAQVVLVGMTSGHVYRRIPTAPSPFSIERVGRHAVVAHTVTGKVTVLERHEMEGFAEPRYTAGAPDGRHAFVSDSGDARLVTIDVLRGVIVGHVRLSQWPRHVSLARDGRTLWVSLGTAADRIAVVDVADPRRPVHAATIKPPFLAHDVGFAPDGRRAWLSSGDRNQLAVFDAGGGRLLARPYGDSPPQHVTFAGRLVYVTSGWSGTLRVHRVDGRPLARTVVPVGSYNVQQTAGWVVTPALGRGYLTVCDERGRIRRSERIARSSHDACIVPA
jgi:hypothetical protein